jgi:hypothetical protein
LNGATYGRPPLCACRPGKPPGIACERLNAFGQCLHSIGRGHVLSPKRGKESLASGRSKADGPVGVSEDAHYLRALIGPEGVWAGERLLRPPHGCTKPPNVDPKARQPEAHRK